MNRVLIVGGSGFIGRHLLERLAGAGVDVRVFDLARGEDAHDLGLLTEHAHGCDTIVHLASNADIAAAATNPTIDFTEGTVLTQNVCEAARLAGVETILYASGSGVYGDVGLHECAEMDPVFPSSPYGASKVAGEALISAYCHMFGMRGIAFRFANVVGPRQTHGVGYDFVRKLRKDPAHLTILGDGHQSKSYVHVDDVISAMLAAEAFQKGPFDVYNVATLDVLTVREIASVVATLFGVDPAIEHAPSWSGDIPVVRLGSRKIRALGWSNRYTSAEAIAHALNAMIKETA